MRTLILTLPEPWSVNNLLRMSYHLRNQRREMLKKEIARQMEKNFGKNWRKEWPPLEYVRLDAIFTFRAKRDRLELPMCLKIEADALQEVGVIQSDGPSHLEPGKLKQLTRGARGVRLRLTELASPIVEPDLDF